MVDQVGHLEKILAEIAPAGETIDLVFVDWAADHSKGHPLRDLVDVPMLLSAGASIGHKGFFEVVCKDMTAAIFALNPLDEETRHIDSFAMETYHDDGTYTKVDLADPEQYEEVKAFLMQMVD